VVSPAKYLEIERKSELPGFGDDQKNPDKVKWDAH
jgi:hypothetical protein